MARLSNRNRTMLRADLLERRDAPSVGLATRVNQETAGDQRTTAVAADAAGNFIAVWQSDGQDGDGLGIYARRFSAAGTPLAPEFNVNAVSVGEQSTPAVAMNAAGECVIVWQSDTQAGTGYDVVAQRYNAAGVAQGGEILVNTFLTDNQAQPAVAIDTTGNFVVAWQSAEQDVASYGIYAQQFTAAGTAQGGEFHVNTDTTSHRLTPAVAMDGDGDFVVVWQSLSAQDGFGTGVFAQRYNAAGATQGGEFLVNTFTALNQTSPAVAMTTAGDFVIAWASFQDGNGTGIYAQRYTAAGATQGGEFPINTTTTGNQTTPAVAIDNTGGFVVTWASAGQSGGNLTDIVRQLYDPAGMPRGGEIRTNATTTGNQNFPAATMDADGDFIIAWPSSGEDGSGYGVYARRLAAPGALLPQVQSVVVNGGDTQRSRLTRVTVTFNSYVGLADNAFTFTGPGGSFTPIIDMSASTPTQTVADLTFSGPGIVGGSIPDGVYTLTVTSDGVTDTLDRTLDGDGNGTSGDDYVLVGDPQTAPKLFRFFGDNDGDGDVDSLDFLAFRTTSGLGSGDPGFNAAFDSDGDGDVDSVDFLAFRNRFGTTV